MVMKKFALSATLILAAASIDVLAADRVRADEALAVAMAVAQTFSIGRIQGLREGIDELSRLRAQRDAAEVSGAIAELDSAEDETPADFAFHGATAGFDGRVITVRAGGRPPAYRAAVGGRVSSTGGDLLLLERGGRFCRANGWRAVGPRLILRGRCTDGRTEF